MSLIRPGVVSTIIPVFNRADLLADAVNSVLAQTYPHNEIIIVDDGSTDDTPAVAKAFAEQHPSVRYVALTRGREWRARNHGLAISTGEFIQFLDSDDLIAPQKLATQVQALRANPHCGISYCYVREYAMGDPLPRTPARRTGETFSELFPAILSGRIWPYPSPLFRRSVIDQAGPFLDMSAYPDWELECRIAANHVPLHHCRVFLAETRNTHRLEGRRRSIKPVHTLRDVAEIYELILGHARGAAQPAAAVAALAPRLFAIGRQCASVGLEQEAQRAIGLANSIATGRRRAWIHAYAIGSRLVGWSTAGRLSEVTTDCWRRLSRPWSRLAALWRHRLRVAFEEVAPRPILAWPGHLTALWRGRPSRQLARRSS